MKKVWIKKLDYVKTPKCLIKKKKNPLTKDKKSFMDAVTLSLHIKSIGKNNTRPNNIRKHSDTIKWENINFSATGQDYKHLEANNEDIKLNVLEMNDKEMFEYIYKCSLDRKNEVNVLLLQKKALCIC